MSQPWSPTKRKRARWVLVLLVLGPILATVVSVIVVPNSPADTITTSSAGTSRSLEVRAVLRNLNADLGEVTLRLQFQPVGTLAGSSGLATPVKIVVLGATEGGAISLTADAPPPLTQLTLPLVGSRVTRYPLDRYETKLVMAAETDAGVPVPLSVRIAANLNDFSTRAELDRPTIRSNSFGARFSFRRNAATLVWSGILIMIFWLVAAGGAMLTWMVIVDNQPIPIWVWAFLTGILFALPPLRVGLPGAPPFGSLVDWLAFYWAVVVVAASLVALMTTWFIRQRALLRAADLSHDRPDA